MGESRRRQDKARTSAPELKVARPSPIEAGTPMQNPSPSEQTASGYARLFDWVKGWFSKGGRA